MIQIPNLFRNQLSLIFDLFHSAQIEDLKLQDSIFADISFVIQEIVVFNHLFLQFDFSFGFTKFVFFIFAIFIELSLRLLPEKSYFGCPVFTQFAIILEVKWQRRIARNFLVSHQLLKITNNFVLMLQSSVFFLFFSYFLHDLIILHCQIFADCKLFVKLKRLIVILSNRRVEVESFRVTRVSQLYLVFYVLLLSVFHLSSQLFAFFLHNHSLMQLEKFCDLLLQQIGVALVMMLQNVQIS